LNSTKDGVRDGLTFEVDVIDTWAMTVTPVPGVFTTKKLDNYVFEDARNEPSHSPANPISRCASARERVYHRPMRINFLTNSSWWLAQPVPPFVPRPCK